MALRTLLAADFGTTSVKLALMDSDLRLHRRHIVPYPMIQGARGMTEQAPEDWWTAFSRGVREIVASDEGTVEGIAICAQMCGLICADATGVALRPAMIWRDKRAAPDARSLIGGLPSVQGYRIDRLLQWLFLANGAPSRNGMDPTAKMRFVLRAEPGIAARTALFLDVRDWIVMRATGVAATTSDCANLTWLMDTRPGREGWSPRLSRLAGIGLDRMPPIKEGTDEVGGLTPRAAADLGLPAGLPVFAGCGDVTAAALGTGAVADGALHICLSTGAWIGGFFERRRLSVAHSYATVASPFEYRPLLIAAQESAGGALGWGRMALAGGTDWEAGPYADLGRPQADDPFAFPWFAGERVPRDDDRLRGAILGLAEHHDGAALRRALIEGVALNLAWAWEKVAHERGVQAEEPIPVVGGGALIPPLVQAVADAIDRPLVLGDDRFAGVAGVGIVGATALGWVPDLWQAAAQRGADSAVRRVAPTEEGRARLRHRGAKAARLRRHLLRATKEF